MGHDPESGGVVALGESGGVGCSSGLIDLSVGGSLRSCLSGILTCRGDSCRFPVIGDGCLFDQLGGPSLLTKGSSSVNGCLGNGVVRMGGSRGRCDDDATGGEGLVSAESSFRFPVIGGDSNFFHSGGVGLLTRGSSSVRGCFGSKGVVRLGVIETMSGNCDEDATGGDGFGVILGKGGMSHGKGMRSSEDGAVFRIGGNGISSGIGDLFHGAGIIGVASLCGGDGVSNWGNGMLTGSSMTMGGGSYCSIDEYCCRCCPQGTKGSGGIMTRGGNSTSGKLEGDGIGTNGDGSTMGGDGTLGTIGGSGMTSLGRDNDG